MHAQGTLVVLEAVVGNFFSKECVTYVFINRATNM